jgi:hypothetical protein
MMSPFYDELIPHKDKTKETAILKWLKKEISKEKDPL